MLTLKDSVCIDAPLESVWAVLSDLDAVHHWVDSIRHSHCPERDRGIGAMRVCELKQATIRETIVAWDEGRSFQYRADGAPMMKCASNTWTVEARGNQTLVTSSAEVVLKGGIFGRMLQPLVRVVARRLGTRSLAALKYLVEHGHTYPGNPRELGPAPASC